ncbi:MAG: molybdate ABC transporter substrate-binding protein [Singulisphaera sp.]
MIHHATVHPEAFPHVPRALRDRVPAAVGGHDARRVRRRGAGEARGSALRDGDAREVSVSVAAAADLKFALEDLIDHFKRRHPAIKVKVTYGSSGSLFAQISQSAPFDIFFSADMDYPRKLIEGGFAGGDGEFLYAEGHIMVWVPNDSPLDLETLGIRAVTAPSVRKVAIANPRHAPYGRAAEAALKNLGVYEEVRDRLVLGENVAQAAQFVASGAADVGIIARSLASAPSMRGEGRSWPVPTGAHPPLRQGGDPLPGEGSRCHAALPGVRDGRGGAGRLPSPRIHGTRGVSMDWTAIGLTLELASCTTAILFALGLPLAYWLATTRRRIKAVVESVVALPLVLPRPSWASTS